MSERNETMSFEITKIQPERLHQRVVNGLVLYTHVISVTQGRTIYISGQLARNDRGEIVCPNDMAGQIRAVGENLKHALEAAGASLADLVKTTTFVTDIDEFFKYVHVRAAYLGSALPTSTTVEVRRLSHPDLMIEIEAVAVVLE